MGAGREGAFFVGRLSQEKGVDTLLRAWNSLGAVPLRIVGDGPLRELVEKATAPSVLLGRKKPVEVAAEMAQAAFLVLPSNWPESFPMTIVEAYCQGLPSIASRIGALPDIIEDGAAGLLFSAGDINDLVTKVNWAHRHPEAMRMMGFNARRVYEEKYVPSINIVELIKIYEAAIEQSRSAAAETAPLN
jgi:glycosyltransferase involved in cell wall biosynthesis